MPVDHGCQLASMIFNITATEIKTTPNHIYSPVFAIIPQRYVYVHTLHPLKPGSSPPSKYAKQSFMFSDSYLMHVYADRYLCKH